MKLLIDVGNSRVKWALWDGAVLREVNELAQGALPDEVDFSNLWKNIDAIDSVWLACVASISVERRLADTLRERFGQTPRSVRSPAFACGVRNAYMDPERLGIDRFLGMVAAHASFREAAVIVSCGTALTLDAIDTHGVHLGGLIAPSPDLMRTALLAGTARLGALEPVAVVDFADNTAAAVASGTCLAAVALVERFVLRTRARIGGEPILILSGGAAPTLAPLLEPAHRIIPNIALHGLAIYADDAVSR